MNVEIEVFKDTYIFEDLSFFLQLSEMSKNVGSVFHGTHVHKSILYDNQSCILVFFLGGGGEMGMQLIICGPPK